MQVRRYGRRFRRPLARPFHRLVHPDVDFADRSDRAGLNQFDHAAVVFGGVNLRAHLSGHLRLLVRFSHQPSFVHRMGQRLFAIHVHAPLHRHQAGRRMRVLGRADDDGVEILLIQQLAPIDVGLGPRKLLGG